VQLEPTCIVQPTSADDVSSVVQTLTSAGGKKAPCQFAVRSGGHMTWAGANNIEPGVTIDLSMMNSTVYQEDAKIASILPGSRWQAVYEHLEGHGVAVPGGRTGPVGVGGFLLGGESHIHPSLSL
jgi:FAD/FMN-containing dehydrogenase